MPPAWAQAAGFVAFGYALRTATLIKDADVQANDSLCCLGLGNGGSCHIVARVN
ncbi:hypothetical protein ABBQ32_009458 [Trebouxia sp. C0010 RCD-2024]